MNPVEQAFSDSPHDEAPDRSSSINKGQRNFRRPIHEDEALCSYILSTVKAPDGALKIQKSTIPGAGSGLFTTRDLTAGELIFTSVPLVLCAEVGEQTEACDFCFQQRRRAIHPVEDRLAHPGEVMPEVYKCKGCNLYQYCSEVWMNSHTFHELLCFYNAHPIWIRIVLLAASLGHWPLIRMRAAGRRLARSRDQNVVPHPHFTTQESAAPGASASPR